MQCETVTEAFNLAEFECIGELLDEIVCIFEEDIHCPGEFLLF